MTTPSRWLVTLLALAATTACGTLNRGPRAATPLITAVMSVDTVNGTVTVPMYRGRVRDTLVWYIVTESSPLGRDVTSFLQRHTPRRSAYAASSVVIVMNTLSEPLIMYSG